MAKRIITPKAAKPATEKAAVVPAIPIATTTPVRNTTIPKPAAPKPTAAVAAPKPKVPKPITYEMISERAYFIAMSGTGGSQDDNWLRAEAELKKESTL